MPITVTCPSCKQLCQVQDQHAGKKVRCPKCSAVIDVPLPAATPINETLPPTVPAEPLSAGPPGPGLKETLQQSTSAFGLDALTVKLLYAGMGCFAGMIVFTMFPWITVTSAGFGIPGIQGRDVGFSFSGSWAGIQFWYGWVNILLTLAAGGFVGAVFLALKKADLFAYSLWAAAGWGLVASLWRLVNVMQAGSFSGIGLYLTLLASLGAAGTFGIIAVKQQMKKR
jgi:hypothetical protein